MSKQSDTPHIHTYDDLGNITCCNLEDKIEHETEIDLSGKNDPSTGHQHVHHHNPSAFFRTWGPALFSLVLLFVGIVLDFKEVAFFIDPLRLIYYLIAFVPVGIPVIREAFASIRHKEFFTEFLLMSLATSGAFLIGEYPEAVAVMVFYTIGENIQSLAVRRAKENIRRLVDQRPDQVTLLQEGKWILVDAQHVVPGSVVQLKHGEKVALDGIIHSSTALLNTSALTGESVPVTKEKGDTILAGMINLNNVSEMITTTEFADSKLSRILALIQEAGSRKAKTELFIRKFARWYTPVVVFIAALLILIPFFFLQENYVFEDWLYRALVFLVISCPCALVISIPLSYFGGLGAASRNGILIKGSNFLDAISDIKNIVFDKTGTLTTGRLKVLDFIVAPGQENSIVIDLACQVARHSVHPVSKAIASYTDESGALFKIRNVTEVSGRGLKAESAIGDVILGNLKWMKELSIAIPETLHQLPNTILVVTINNRYAAHVIIGDEIKMHAKDAIDRITRLGINTFLFSGDRQTTAEKAGQHLGIGKIKGDLLPDEKLREVEEVRNHFGPVAFVGDGVNDAPAIALSDVGIAMGGLGSDAAIETADIVIQNDNLLKIPAVIELGKATKKIVWQNISMAFGVKLIVLVLGAGGLATLWEAVFADVGVALLAILNAIRLQNKNFD